MARPSTHAAPNTISEGGRGEPREEFVIRLRAGRDKYNRDAFRRLKLALKTLGRMYALECTSIEQAKETRDGA